MNNLNKQLNAIGDVKGSKFEQTLGNQILQYLKDQDKFARILANTDQDHLYSKKLQEVIVKKDNAVKEFVATNGIIAYQAMEILDNKDVVTLEQIEKKVNEIRNKSLTSFRVLEEQKRLEEKINNLDLSDVQIVALYEELEKAQSLQMLHDVNALVASFEMANIRNNEIAKSCQEALSGINFKIKTTTQEITEDNVLLTNITAYNKIFKRINLKIFADGRLEYELGNYEGHMCEPDSEKFRALLSEKYSLTAPKIIRKSSNRRPIQKAMKVREK